MSVADEAIAAELEIPSNQATPLAAKPTRCRWVTIWRAPCDVGVGGEKLNTDAHLEAGDTHTFHVADLAGLYVFHRQQQPVLLRYTYGV